MPTFAIATLGCKTNQFESASLDDILTGAGYTAAPFEDGADLVIINTCTVTAKTDAQSRNLIRRARRINPLARIVVTGCYAQVNPEELAAMEGVELVIGNEEKQSFLDRLATAEQIQVTPSRSVTGSFEVPAASTGRTRAFLQIQNGCDAFCSYCIIPYARGRSRSATKESILTQVQQLQEAGYAEIVLTGIHIGGYGKDLDPPDSLVGLVRSILATNPSARIRLGSIEPNEIDDELIALIASDRRIAPHLHIPLQSGDDSVLAAMNRHYSTADFRSLISRIHRAIPHIAIGLDVIVGFPGETDEQFATTCDLIRELPVAFLHVFPYSKRPGTPAADMANQVPGNLTKERAATLRDIGDAKRLDYARSAIGTTREIIIEREVEKGIYRGTADTYLEVEVHADERLEGILSVKISECDEEGILSGVLSK